MLKKSLVFAGLATSLLAHSLWVNSFESFTHKPGHTTIVLGWGHTMPIDDILNSPNGKMVIKEFNFIDPNGKKTALSIPDSKTASAALEKKSFDVFKADLGAQKIAFKEDSEKGVYTVEAISKPNYYTAYIDKKGKQRMKLKPKNEVKDIDKVLMSIRFQAYAKSYITLGKWSEQKPLGHGLEIIPQTDLSHVKVGDLVRFKVLFNGKELDANAKSIDYITANSSSFGQSDGFNLHSYIMKGNAQIRVQSRGKWIVSTYHKGDVTKDGALKKYYGKAEQVYHNAALTFDVK